MSNLYTKFLTPNNDYGTIANYQSLKWMPKQVFAQVSKFCMGKSTHKVMHEDYLILSNPHMVREDHHYRLKQIESWGQFPVPS